MVRVYIIARISQDAHAWTDWVCAPLEQAGICVFKPKDHNPWNKLKHEQFSREVYETDLSAMMDSHIGLILPEYGRDCAWEAGWYANSTKPLAVFVDSQTEWLRDWMVKGRVNNVVTTNPVTYCRILKDPILKDADVWLINSINDLPRATAKICRNNYGNTVQLPASLADVFAD